MLLVKNRRALRNYSVVEKFMAGIVLKGYEAKAIREKKVNFDGAHIKIVKGQPFVVGMHIGRYSKQSQDIEDTRVSRKLLLNKSEIKKLELELNKKGKTGIPLALVLRNNMIKLELAVVAGKKKHEKKVVEKEKQIKKDLEKFNSEVKKSIWG